MDVNLLTGPITVFNYTVYDIIAPRGTNYFAFMCWIGLYGISHVAQSSWLMVRQVVPSDALDTRYYQCLQRSDLCNEF